MKTGKKQPNRRLLAMLLAMAMILQQSGFTTLAMAEDESEPTDQVETLAEQPLGGGDENFDVKDEAVEKGAEPVEEDASPAEENAIMAEAISENEEAKDGETLTREVSGGLFLMQILPTATMAGR